MDGLHLQRLREVCSRCGIYSAVERGLCERCLDEEEARDEEEDES
jgi:hypothetical protein